MGNKATCCAEDRADPFALDALPGSTRRVRVQCAGEWIEAEVPANAKLSLSEALK